MGTVTGRPAADVVQGDVLEFLKQLGNGRILFDLTHGLQQVVEGVREYPQQQGSITLKIVVSPMKKGESERVLADGNVTVKAPRKPAETKVFFTTKTNVLVREDPRQMGFEGEDFTK
jgi:hypothetical protein